MPNINVYWNLKKGRFDNNLNCFSNLEVFRCKCLLLSEAKDEQKNFKNLVNGVRVSVDFFLLFYSLLNFDFSIFYKYLMHSWGVYFVPLGNADNLKFYFFCLSFIVIYWHSIFHRLPLAIKTNFIKISFLFSNKKQNKKEKRNEIEIIEKTNWRPSFLQNKIVFKRMKFDNLLFCNRKLSFQGKLAKNQHNYCNFFHQYVCPIISLAADHFFSLLFNTKKLTAYDFHEIFVWIWWWIRSRISFSSIPRQGKRFFSL